MKPTAFDARGTIPAGCGRDSRADDKVREVAAMFVRSYTVSMKQPVISCSPDIMGGTAVFFGTRVPIQTLLDYLEAGESIDDFLEGFPSVTREQVVAFLEEAKDRLVSTMS